MLTRLKISGFKNLVDVDVRFGPFTCIAGPNGVGKSNLFDAIRFLSALSEMPLMDAALSVRDEAGRSGNISALFHRVGNTIDHVMSFEAEIIIPNTGYDDLGQTATAKITFLRYTVKLAYQPDNASLDRGTIALQHEELVHINKSDAVRNLRFLNKPAWRDSVVIGRRTGAFISTETGGMIKVHQDGKSGQPRQFRADSVPRTLLSVSNASESPTALLARRELQSWQLLQLEPSALRRPDDFNAPPRLGSDGSHLPATLYRLAKSQGTDPRTNAVYAEVANRLSDLIKDVRSVEIDRDERRELLTLMASLQDGTTYPAKALSDGTLRFLALSVLELDPQAVGVICLEEPENGIHPARIPAMIKLLKDIATDPEHEVDETNPLRQVIINTHSPVVVQLVPDDSLLVAELKEAKRDAVRFNHTRFSYLPDTWRVPKDEQLASEKANTVAKGVLLNYLNPVPSHVDSDFSALENGDEAPTRGQKRVIDRPDIQPLLPGFPELEEKHP